MRKVLLGLMCLLLLAGGLIATSILTEDAPKAGLLLAASREASMGGLWLGLYQDRSFAYGQFERDITARGAYRFQGDTLLLTADPGTTITKGRPNYRFLLRNTRLVEILRPTEEMRIGFLTVRRNALNAHTPILSEQDKGLRSERTGVPKGK